MAAAISPNTGRAYGVARVCDGFGVARSSFYAWRRQQESTAPPQTRLRRGPKPAIADAAVLSAIRADLDRSPWIDGKRPMCPMCPMCRFHPKPYRARSQCR